MSSLDWNNVALLKGLSIRLGPSTINIWPLTGPDLHPLYCAELTHPDRMQLSTNASRRHRYLSAK